MITEPTQQHNTYTLESVRETFRLNDGVVISEKVIDPKELIKPDITGPAHCELSHGDIEHFIDEWIPKCAQSVMCKIEFRPLTGDERDSDAERIGYATYSPARAESYIAIASDVLNAWSYDLQQKSQDTAEMQKEILMTIAHEYGHALHYVAPVKLLKRWLDERGVPLAGPESEYYQTTEKDVPEQEDFAEVFALYVCDPDNLYALSESQYMAMHDLLVEVE